MVKLNCKAGDLAITVKSHNPENLGTIVTIKSPNGMVSWGKGTPEFTWLCEIASKGWLVYDVNGYVVTQKVGLVPDRCLKPITPPKSYLLDEFRDSAQISLELFDSEPM